MQFLLDPATKLNYNCLMEVRILINKNARAIRSEKLSSTIFKRFLSDRVQVRETASVEQIDEVVMDCWQSDVDLVVLATGDGGLHRFLSSFVNIYQRQRDLDGELKKLPLFATLRTGTANLVTGILGGKGKPKQAVERLFAQLERVRNSEDLPRIKQKLLSVYDGIEQRFGFIAGIGAVYNFFTEYYQGTRHSVMKFLKIFTKAIFSLFTGTNYLNRLFASVEARLRLDEKLERLSRWKMLAVSAIETKVVFFHAFRFGGLMDHIHVKAGNPSRLAIIRNIPNLFFNRALKGRELLDRLVEKVSFEREEGFGYTIDGELYFAHRLDLCSGPEVEFLRF